MRVNVTVFTSEGGKYQLPLQLDRTDTIFHLKQEIQLRFGFLPEDQRVVFGGELQNDDQTLAECGIEEDARVQVVSFANVPSNLKDLKLKFLVLLLGIMEHKTETSNEADELKRDIGYEKATFLLEDSYPNQVPHEPSAQEGQID